MFKHLFDHAQDLAGYPVFSLVIFFVFFVVVSVYVVKSSKKHVDEMSNMPLDENEKPSGNIKL
jgi:cytochrome c oxidase cbb3-type subunit 4